MVAEGRLTFEDVAARAPDGFEIEALNVGYRYYLRGATPLRRVDVAFVAGEAVHVAGRPIDRGSCAPTEPLRLTSLRVTAKARSKAGLEATAELSAEPRALDGEVARGGAAEMDWNTVFTDADPATAALIFSQGFTLEHAQLVEVTYDVRGLSACARALAGADSASVAAGQPATPPPLPPPVDPA